MPEISVVISLYNKAEYIARAIDSVLAQKFSDFEVIVVNDASSDGGERIAAEYQKSGIKLFNRPSPSPGGHAARNMGIRESSGNLVAFLDADDEWTPKFLETIMRLRNKYPGAGLYATAYLRKYNDGRIKNPDIREIPEDNGWEGIVPDYFRSCIYGTSPVCTSAAAIPKAVFASSGMFPEGVNKGGDRDMWVRIALKYPVVFSRRPCALYNMDIPGSVSKTNRAIYGYRAVENIEKFLNDNANSDKRDYIREYANKLRLSSVAQCIETGNFKLGIKHLKECRTRMFRRKKLRLFLMLLFLKCRMKRNHKNENSN
ncbi:MAG: glycosyltransferase family 2 protein [Candidatus Omnitrophica bacterium]|nr:glycosyltransferase family 2 protein [Candidatus Omnitrophota bacterium]